MEDLFNDKIERDPEEEKILQAEYEKIAEELLCKFGPEGAFEIADKLNELAGKNVEAAMRESYISWGKTGTDNVATKKLLHGGI